MECGLVNFPFTVTIGLKQSCHILGKNDCPNVYSGYMGLRQRIERHEELTGTRQKRAACKTSVDN
jgi:hypothetical protein